jgi:hypothetical protein
MRYAVVLVVVNGALLALFAVETSSRGLLTPGGSPRLDVVGVGVAYLVFRVALRFLLPALLCFGASQSLVSRIMRAWGTDS